jgi:uncharacterized protein YbjQ (UPF0145 family)
VNVEVAVQLGIVIGLLLLGVIAGRASEARHLKSLGRREAALQDVLVTDLRNFPEPRAGARSAELVVAEVVIAADSLKVFLASLRGILGGEITSYRSLMIRARREAVLRLVEQAHAKGYNALANVRLEGADIGGSAVRSGMAMVCILASATAYHADVRARVHPYRSPG